MTQTRDAELDRLQRSLEARGADGVELCLVLGSGLGPFAERLVDPVSIPYEELEGMPTSGVEGHAGRLVLGELAGARVLVQQGRVHLYEGWSAVEVTRAVRALAGLGCRGFVLTNAAGGLNPDWSPGTLMRIADHLNLQGRTPLSPAGRGSGAVWSEGLGAALERGATEAGVDLESGVYAALLGPSYETPAEIRMLRWMGADAVGMSTAAEALAIREAGCRVAGISLITNLAAGLSPTALSHDEVVREGQAAAERFSALLEASVPHLVAELAR